MASTKYQIETLNTEGNFEAHAVRSEKAAAVATASNLRTTEKVTVRVVTVPASGDMTKSKVVEVFTAGKRVRRSAVWAKPYTRLDSRVTAPEGWDVAYFRPRRNAATLRRVEDGVVEYAISRPDGTILRRGIQTTEACSRYLAGVTKAEDTNA